jgi:integrase
VGYVYPIKDEKSILAMRRFLAGESKRDELLFILGINTAFRISDILKMKFSDLYDKDGKPVKNLYAYIEAKTKKKKTLPISDKVEKCLREYIKDFPSWQPDDFIFQSRKGSKPITRQHAHRILNAAAIAINMPDPIGTHTLRKTFAYTLYKKTGNIALVQKILNHASQSDTMRYIGLEQEELDAAYRLVNLG